MRSTFNILFYINRRKVKKNGKCPVMGRITVDGKIAQFSVKEEITPSLWSSKEGRSTGKEKADRKLNQKLERYREELKVHYNRLVEKEAYVTVESLKNALLNGKPETLMLLAEFKAHNKEYLKSVGISKMKGSYDGYDHACKALEKFITDKCGLKDIAFRELDSSFIKDFDFYLRENLQLSPATVFNVIMKLKRIIRRAINQEIIHKNSFADFMCEPGDTTRKWLSKADLDAIMHTIMEDQKAEQLRILFVFAAFTGLAFVDLYNLRNKNISTDDKGIVWIRIKRKKTGTQAIIPLLEIPLSIYNKYRNSGTDAEKKVFVVPSYPLARIYLEKIRIAAKLKTLKFHFARHTYATTICLSNGIPIETLSRMLGHKNISTTQIYAKITSQKVEKDTLPLEKRLNGKYHFPQDYNLQKQTAI